MPVSPFTRKRLAKRLREEVVSQPITVEEARAKVSSIMEELLNEILANRKPKDDFKVTTSATPEQQAQGIMQVDIEIDRNSPLGQAYLRNTQTPEPPDDLALDAEVEAARRDAFPHIYDENGDG